MTAQKLKRNLIAEPPNGITPTHDRQPSLASYYILKSIQVYKGFGKAGFAKEVLFAKKVRELLIKSA